jgi:starch synthase (maltosyl-transferring)
MFGDSMDAHPDTGLSRRERAAEALRIMYLEPRDVAGPAFARAKELGFRQVLIGPPWDGFVRRDRFLVRDFRAAGGLGLQAIASATAAAGVDLLLDVQVDRLAAASPLADAVGSPFQRPDEAALRDPRRGVDADAAVASMDGPGDALALAAWWAAVLRGWCQEGVGGFRLLGLAALPDELAGVFFGALRQALPAAVLLAWTPGMRRSAVAGLRGRGADGVFASLPWWDFASSWVWDEIASLVQVAPVIGADAVPGGPDIAPAGRSLALAATIGQGFLHSGKVQNEESLRALNAVLAECSLLSRLSPPRLPTGDGGPVLAFVRLDGVDHRVSSRAALVVVNTDAQRTLSFSAASVLPALGGVFGPFRTVLPASEAVLQPRTVLSLKPGEVRLFTAEALKRPGKVEALEKSAAKQAASWPRLAIERPSPCVDGGAFPVKAIAGELVGVEADIVFDGHDKISAALRWQAPGETEWQEVPMRQLGNDRWQAAFPLERLGRHVYVVSAWRDRFETFRDELAKKSAAGVKIALEVIEGEALVKEAAGRKKVAGADQLLAVLERLRAAGEPEKLAILLSPELARLMTRADDRPFCAESAPIPVDAERIEARFASWYEVFPRSMSDDEQRHGTFADVEKHLPRIRDMGFDVLYFPPIHPIGRINRKGRNNTLTPAPDDPGSPYAIGSAEGGHDALHPQLGTFADFAHLRAAAAAHGLELAIDFAVQCSPDHPWLKTHPGWFDWRPDGTIRYAENPPKKYEDIVNVDFYAKDAVPELWMALCEVVLFWAGQGVRLFRVDNPHTKPLPFWMWMIGEVKARYPDAIFLAEAFTRPKVMYRLAKIGFSQSYTYFTWRNSKRELEAYLTELDTEPPKDFFRPHFFVNTPDINPLFLQGSGRPGFLIRAALAATLSGLWGVYNGFELCESEAIPGKEEYANSEKYQLRAWDWDRPGNIVSEITALNRLRRQNPALQTHRGVTFLLARNDAILYYEKATADRSNVVLVAVSLDPHQAQEAEFEVPLWSWKLPDQASLNVEDLLSGDRFAWHGKTQHMRLAPARPYAAWRVRPI